MKKFSAVFLTVAALLMIGCGKQSESSGEPYRAAMAKAFIGIAMPDTQVTRWIKDGNSLKTEAEKRGYRAAVQLSDSSQSIQNRQITSFINAGAKLLIVGNVNDEVGPVIAEAAAAKVEVIAYDRLILNSADYDYFITFNNYEVGVLNGESLVKGLDLDNATAGKPKLIALFAGAPTDGNAYFFYDGAMSVLNPYIENGVLKVIGAYTKTSDDKENFIKIATENWHAPFAGTRMESILANEAKGVVLDAILAPNDSIARAIINVCMTDAKYRNKLPLVTGQDAEFESVMSIKKGEQYNTIFKNTTKLAEAAVILADQILNGVKTPDIPGAVLAEGHLAKMGDTGRKTVKTYLLNPVLVTRETLNIPIDAGFYTDAEAQVLK